MLLENFYQTSKAVFAKRNFSKTGVTRKTGDRKYQNEMIQERRDEEKDTGLQFQDLLQYCWRGQL